MHGPFAERPAVAFGVVQAAGDRDARPPRLARHLSPSPCSSVRHSWAKFLGGNIQRRELYFLFAVAGPDCSFYLGVILVYTIHAVSSININYLPTGGRMARELRTG